jgi:high-affinity K+ transport system ATPase subunit B
MNEFEYLNPDNFKKWMKSQNDFESNLNNTVIGLTAETKFSGKRIIKNITLEQGRANKVVKEFIENGGIVKEVNENEYLIEVSSGSFYINKKFVIV